MCLPPPGDVEDPSSPEAGVLEGQGSIKLEGWWLRLRQFHGLIIKRFHCAKRNTKGLFSQIMLPAFFVCVAMTVALSVPAIGTCYQGGGSRHAGLGQVLVLTLLFRSTGDLPPLILSPSQYHNYTQPRGNFIPYANEDRPQYRSETARDVPNVMTENRLYSYIDK